MLAWAADENLNQDIVRGLLRRDPRIDILRVQDVGLSGADDPTVLAWAAAESRVLLTHDVATMTRYAYDRVRQGLPMPGVFEVPLELDMGHVIEAILLLTAYSMEDEWEAQVRYLPLR